MNLSKLCLEIFFFRIIDVTLATFSTILTIKNKRIASTIIGFINALIWFFIVKEAINTRITSLWIEKFEKIPIPYSNVDIGNYNYNSSNSFDNMLDSVYYPTASSSGSSGGGGCSSCGGGCSSCGGGCSSCGGGGSW